MIYAVQDVVFPPAEILARTQGQSGPLVRVLRHVRRSPSPIHAAIGLRVIAHEMAGLRGTALTVLTWGIALALEALGTWALWAVTFAAPDR